MKTFLLLVTLMALLLFAMSSCEDKQSATPSVASLQQQARDDVKDQMREKCLDRIRRIRRPYTVSIDETNVLEPEPTSPDPVIRNDYRVAVLYTMLNGQVEHKEVCFLYHGSIETVYPIY